jgi:hypothetical protein
MADGGSKVLDFGKLDMDVGLIGPQTNMQAPMMYHRVVGMGRTRKLTMGSEGRHRCRVRECTGPEAVTRLDDGDVSHEEDLSRCR